MNPSGKVVLVTGGGSGIGLAIAKSFLNAGSTVVICGRNQAKLEKVKESEDRLNIHTCDVTSSESIKTVLQYCETEFGGVDILVNNAGIFNSVDHKSNAHSMDDILNEIDIDFAGPIRVSHHALPGLLKKKEAAIVNVSSGLAFVPLAGAPVYCGTKAGVHSWTRSLRYQLKNSTVKVVELMPPLVETDMVAEFEGFPMMKPEKLASDFLAGFKSGKTEITPGQSSQLKMMSRLAPEFIFNQVNKQFEK